MDTEIDMNAEPTKKEKIIALKMFVASGIMAFEGMRTLGTEEEIVKSVFMAWLDSGSDLFGKEIFCKACVFEIDLMRKAAEKLQAFGMNQVVQC